MVLIDEFEKMNSVQDGEKTKINLVQTEKNIEKWHFFSDSLINRKCSQKFPSISCNYM